MNRPRPIWDANAKDAPCRERMAASNTFVSNTTIGGSAILVLYVIPESAAHRICGCFAVVRSICLLAG